MSKYHSNKVYVVNHDGLQKRFYTRTSAQAFCDENNLNFKTDVEIFDSNKELYRWELLKVLEQRGEISDLQRQVPYVLIPAQYTKILKTVRKKEVLKDKRIEAPITYKADFQYRLNGKLVVEDVKSEYTRKLPEYVIKRKLMLYIHNIKLKEII